ncbi:MULTISPECIES: zinc transporter ZntB [unclassified Pseudomonas]|uniref:zinc transporter ZntB n=1 Tax=unclassified Pseudomonas TaxID=196821 RepID=UPI002AC8E60B|nr:MULTISPECIES: zinc transporter ZntB [unclassified Pseudomonas]MEB0039952.1 zinc transporter ZntB [Pseudomonas sp. MH10]MEB0076347.1 zinc transporter ZntB [Pseudomonas sp. MH10out]MEB0092760.1 zinc transporter ZntB [Pseudomonas sp. CCI4.2]MEB0101014.1 zinc transporter ZntB [Pseudomonas sp. CCI3.2]MEB0119476.1 zinc transporter ZntB [Pseudomonas sp. CCI1.2]
MFDETNAQWGLVHALVLDGQGGARFIARTELEGLQLQPHESVWLHWDRGHPQTQTWLRTASGLSEFSCDLLLEENTRPRLVPLPDAELLLFLRGVNLNPGAEPEDMVSVRIFAAPQQVISLRLRQLRATDELIECLTAGIGPKTASELILYLAQYLTDKVQALVGELSELVDVEEEKIDADERYAADHGDMLHIRRRAAGLRRFLAPQREVYAQLTRNKVPWFVEEDANYWNELNNSLTRYLEELELTRERVGLVLETEDRRLSERMNRVMYRFGIITGIFLPMSFLTGLLGVNVGGIPGSTNPYGFLIACSIMGAVGIGQYWLFRRLRWV